MVHVTPYFGEELLKNCRCPDCQKVSYSIRHDEKPLILTEKLMKAIEVLLWYSPNVVNTAQTIKNEYLKDPIFEDAIINYFLMYSKLQANDICFVSDDILQEDLIAPYVDRVCRTCQKIIVCKRPNESKMTCVLRHMRNCIAHGRLNIVETERVIGFDQREPNKINAVFLLSIDALYEFCLQLLKFPDFTISQIFQYAFLNQKELSVVLPVQTGGENFKKKDLSEELVFVKSEGKTYRINCSRYKNGVNSFEPIDEYFFGSDQDFGKETHFIDLYYSEKEECLSRMLATDKYVIGKTFLINLLQGEGACDMLGI